MLELFRLNTPKYFSPVEENDLIYFLNNHTDNFYVAEISNKIIGCGGFNLSEDNESAKISWDIFHPQNHGKGFGSELLLHRIKKIKEIHGIICISVRTSQFTYKFYEKFGFEIKEIIQNYWTEGFDLYRMEGDINKFNKH
ncbi:MAG: GNAT family N-acetyltransferase [Bacteroidetes bacterium]|nr:GNAT family N-acetyltransferase [Bacteroidota bacterium]